jgi:hypothetical protein
MIAQLLGEAWILPFKSINPMTSLAKPGNPVTVL